MKNRLNRRCFGLLASVVALLGATGCSTLALNQSASSAANAEAKEAGSPDKKTPTFVIQFKTEGRLVASKTIPIEGDMFIQDALNKSGAFNRFRRSTIDLVRITPQGARHSMAVAHDRSKHRIEPQCNYAVHPGDTLVLTEDKSTVIDDMMGSFGGPFSKKGQTAHTSSGG